jgi:uncharacterized Fe-S cluster protein YjdI
VSRKRYKGHAVDVSFDADVCEHSGNCVRSLPAVFDTAKRPWIQPDNESAEAVMPPSGAAPAAPSGSRRRARTEF